MWPILILAGGALAWYGVKVHSAKTLPVPLAAPASAPKFATGAHVRIQNGGLDNGATGLVTSSALNASGVWVYTINTLESRPDLTLSASSGVLESELVAI